jgi:hypothetical protein
MDTMKCERCGNDQYAGIVNDQLVCVPCIKALHAEDQNIIVTWMVAGMRRYFPDIKTA